MNGVTPGGDAVKSDVNIVAKNIVKCSSTHCAVVPIVVVDASP